MFIDQENDPKRPIFIDFSDEWLNLHIFRCL